MKRLYFRIVAAGWLVLLCVQAAAVTRYVDLNSPNPTPSYTSWTTAATNIQDAVDAAVAGDLVLVTNGVYQTGGQRVSGDLITNRVAVTKAITLQSVNGPNVTVIRGYQLPGTNNGPSAIRCVYLSITSTLSGFTVTGGATLNYTLGNPPPFAPPSSPSHLGGGIRCQLLFGYLRTCMISNCVVVDNTGATAAGIHAGLVYGCVISNNVAVHAGGGLGECVASDCIITGNSAAHGGGAYASGLNDCLIKDNSAQYGGGTRDCGMGNCTCIGNIASIAGGGLAGFGDVTSSMSPINNCIVYGNTAPTNSNFYPCDTTGDAFRFTNCCTTPLPYIGMANFTNPPLFLNEAGGDYRLQPNSPCINSGKIISGTSLVDLDGNPRIVGGAVDIGAYEFQSPASVLSYAWAQQNGLPTDGSADFSDADGDGANNWQEWRADTIPTNSVSALRLVSATNSPSGAVVTWQSVATRNYWLERATNLGVASPFQTIATNIVGTEGTKTFTDTTPTGDGPYLYRIGVQ